MLKDREAQMEMQRLRSASADAATTTRRLSDADEQSAADRARREAKVRSQCRVKANRGPSQLFARAPLLPRDKDLSQPATRVDTTCWQLFRPDISTARFYFCCRSYVKLLDY